jgi:hypothetical protein
MKILHAPVLFRGSWFAYAIVQTQSLRLAVSVSEISVTIYTKTIVSTRYIEYISLNGRVTRNK